MSILGAHRLRTIDQPARPNAPATSGLAVEQPKPLRAPVAPWAYEARPEAAVLEVPHPHADLVFDAIVAKPDKRRHSAARDVAVRHEGRYSNHRQIVDRALHKLRITPLDTNVYFAVHRARRPSERHLTPRAPPPRCGRWGRVGVAAPNAEGQQNQGLQAIALSLLCGALALLLAPRAEAQGATPPAAPQTPSLTEPLDCPFCDLTDAQLANRNLADANLQRANLTGANLSGADLSGAILFGANLTNANLSGAKLNRSAKGAANLQTANLTGVNLRGASLDGTVLQHTDLSAFDHTNVDLSQAIIVTPLAGGAVTCGKANLSNIQTRIYVAQRGADGPACGTAVANACATIDAGIKRCNDASACGVLVMYGEYKPTSPIELADGVNLYGGCAAGPAPLVALQSLVTAPAGGQPAMIAGGIAAKGVILQGFLLQGATGAKGSASTALAVIYSNKLQVIDSDIVAGRGGAGDDGQTGLPGGNGAAGLGATAGANAQCPSAAGGNGADEMAEVRDRECRPPIDENFGCRRGHSWKECVGYQAAMGAKGGTPGQPVCANCIKDPQDLRSTSFGGTGNVGGTGNNGSCGTKGIVSVDKAGAFSDWNWRGGAGGAGGVGFNGGGGGGGGPGGGAVILHANFLCFSSFFYPLPGNKGGGGGAGGCGGAGGPGGQQGGASFAVTMFRSDFTLIASTIVGGRGGAGGKGGDGAIGGGSGPGGAGGSLSLKGTPGGAGQPGGGGGAGGGGGGGAGGNGGPATGIALVSNSSVVDTDAKYYTGASGTPGGIGKGATPGSCKAPDGEAGVAAVAADKQTYAQ